MTNKLKLKFLKGLNSLKEIVLKSIEFQKDLESLPQSHKEEYESIYNEMYSNSVLRNQLSFRPFYYPTLEQTIKVRVTTSPELLSIEDWKGYLNYGIENAQTNIDDVISLPAINIEGEVIADGKGFIKIDKIQLSNFRFFIDDEANNSFELEEGKNMLLYGENGSGKSSIFKAFEFLSKVSKEDISQEFRENKNRFNFDKDSSISFAFDNNEILDINDDTSTNDELVFINNLSVFMPILNYQNLLKVSYQEKQESEKNLYDFFETILENYPIDDDKVLKDLKESKDIRYFDIFEEILQNELFDYINMFLSDFNQGFTLVKIEFNKPFKIISLDIEYFNEEITQYHLFLNEARLSALAISIYFSIIKSQFRLLGEHSLKILVLDDLLISLDMSNRLTLINILKNEFSDFQIFFFTHDKGFFEVLKDKMSWKAFEMYVDSTGNFVKPFINKESLTYLEKADKYFRLNDYEIVGNSLRKEAEHFCKGFLSKKDEDKFDLGQLVTESISVANNIGLDDTLFTKLDHHRKFVLNPRSHDNYEVPTYKNEIEDALNTLKELREIRNEPFLERGKIVEFELFDGTDTYTFEIKLNDDFRLLTIEGQNSVISKGKIIYWVKKNGEYTKGTKDKSEQYDTTILKKFYDYNYANSDKTKNSDFWEEIIIKETGEKVKICIEN